MKKNLNIAIDTNVIIDFVREEEKFNKFKEEYPDNKLGVSVFNIMEVYSSSNLEEDIEKYRTFLKKMDFTLAIDRWVDCKKVLDVSRNEKEPEVLRNEMLKWRSIVEVESLIQLIDHTEMIINEYYTQKNNGKIKSLNGEVNILIDRKEEMQRIFEQAYKNGDILDKMEEEYTNSMIKIIESYITIKNENREDGKLYKDFDKKILKKSIEIVFDIKRKSFNGDYRVNRLEKLYHTIEKLMMNGTKIRNVKNDFIVTIVSGPLTDKNFCVCTKDRNFCISLEENGYKLISDEKNEYKIYSK